MQPSLLGNINSYAMWQAFQLSNRINISGHTLDQYEIYHSIYRQSKPLSRFGHLMLPKKSSDDYPDEIKELIVTKLHEDAFMGLFLPCKKMPQLRIFENLHFGS